MCTADGVPDGSGFRSAAEALRAGLALADYLNSADAAELEPAALGEALVSLGEIPATSPLTQIPFGWEISDTGGKPVTFSISRFDVSLQN